MIAEAARDLRLSAKVGIVIELGGFVFELSAQVPQNSTTTLPSAPDSTGTCAAAMSAGENRRLLSVGVSRSPPIE